MRRFWLRLGNILGWRSAEHEMARETESHLALLREDFERRGLAPQDAALLTSCVNGAPIGQRYSAQGLDHLAVLFSSAKSIRLTFRGLPNTRLLKTMVKCMSMAGR